MSSGFPESNPRPPSNFYFPFGLTFCGLNSAARQRRKYWTDVNEFADELWTYMSRLRDQNPASRELVQQDGTVIQIDDGNIDFDFGEPPDIEFPEQPTPEDQQFSIVENRIDRTVVPCRVGEKIASDGGIFGVATYNATLFPYGVRAEIYTDTYDPEDITEDEDKLQVDAVVLQLSMDEDEIIPVGTWTLCNRITPTTITTNYLILQGVLQQPTQIIQTGDSGNFIQVPIWL